MVYFNFIRPEDVYIFVVLNIFMFYGTQPLRWNGVITILIGEGKWSQKIRLRIRRVHISRKPKIIRTCFNTIESLNVSTYLTNNIFIVGTLRILNLLCLFCVTFFIYIGIF